MTMICAFISRLFSIYIRNSLFLVFDLFDVIELTYGDSLCRMFFYDSRRGTTDPMVTFSSSHDIAILFLRMWLSRLFYY